MTGVVERSSSQSQILKGIQDKNTECSKTFLVLFRDEMMDFKGELKLVLKLSGRGRYLTSKLSNICMNRISCPVVSSKWKIRSELPRIQIKNCQIHEPATELV